MTPHIEALLRLARQSIQGATAMRDQRLFRFSVARSYYTMFYCAQALHLREGRSFSKHAAVIAGFGQHFVKTGLFDKKFHDYLRNAFQHRQRGDYDAIRDVSEETARLLLEQSREFLAATTAFLSQERPQ